MVLYSRTAATDCDEEGSSNSLKRHLPPGIGRWLALTRASAAGATERDLSPRPMRSGTLPTSEARSPQIDSSIPRRAANAVERGDQHGDRRIGAFGKP